MHQPRLSTPADVLVAHERRSLIEAGWLPKPEPKETPAQDVEPLKKVA